jgi:hypothetical protein
VEELSNKKPLIITRRFVQLKIHLSLSIEKAKILLPNKKETKILFHAQSVPENSQLIELTSMKLYAKELEEPQPRQGQLQRQLP